MNYLVVCGGSMSGLGKGTTVSSIGVLLKACGFRVTCMKIDPYLVRNLINQNVDAGTMSPYEHGEVFVLDDGAEVDLDLGNYQRFMNLHLTRDHNMTTGKIYSKVISSERKGQYLGKTVQVVPHVTDAIMEWIEKTAEVPVCLEEPGTKADICLIEIGGTVGDLESGSYYESMRQMQLKVGFENMAIVFVSYVPVLDQDQIKTKPTQHGVRTLRMIGLNADMIVCRCSIQIPKETREKVALFTNVKSGYVISAHNVKNIFSVPLLFGQQNFHQIIAERLNLGKVQLNITKWIELNQKINNLKDEETKECSLIAIVGKYTKQKDCYLSLIKALTHSSIAAQVKIQLEWIESTHLRHQEGLDEPTAEQRQRAVQILKKADGILIPGGFGDRGVLGKIEAAKYARQNNIPYLGICLGMQIAVIEFSRNVLGLTTANSTEFNEKTEDPVVIYMPQISKEVKGGTMRLGLHTTTITDQDSLASKVYGGMKMVDQRHRHRYEVNTKYLEALEANGMIFTGHDTKNERMEICELKKELGHPFFFGTQFHPEFLTKPMSPSPPFLHFVKATRK